MAHFTRVALYDVRMGDIVWTFMTERENSIWSNEQYVFMRCRDVPPEKLGMLSINGSTVAEVPVAF